MKKLKKEDLINLIIKALNFPKKKYKNTASLNSFEDWDSIGHLNIMLQLDQKLSGKAKNIKDNDYLDKLAEMGSKYKTITSDLEDPAKLVFSRFQDHFEISRFQDVSSS